MRPTFAPPRPSANKTPTGGSGSPEGIPEAHLFLPNSTVIASETADADSPYSSPAEETEKRSPLTRSCTHRFSRPDQPGIQPATIFALGVPHPSHGDLVILRIDFAAEVAAMVEEGHLGSGSAAEERVEHEISGA